MFLENLIHNGQTQARADTDTLGCKSRIEYLFQFVLWNTNARVLNRNVYLTVLLRCGQGDLALIFDGLLGVDEQIQKHLIQPARKTGNSWQLAVISIHRNVVFDFVVNQG